MPGCRCPPARCTSGDQKRDRGWTLPVARLHGLIWLRGVLTKARYVRPGHVSAAAATVSTVGSLPATTWCSNTVQRHVQCALSTVSGATGATAVPSTSGPSLSPGQSRLSGDSVQPALCPSQFCAQSYASQTCHAMAQDEGHAILWWRTLPHHARL